MALKNVVELASRQLRDYHSRTPGTLFADGLTLTVAEAYELQQAVFELRQRDGERTIGYKVGCTSPVIREQLNIDHCVSGRLYESERYTSGAEICRRDFAGLAIEGELAVQLAREPQGGDFASDGIPACVGQVIPVVELHHFVVRGPVFCAGELIANNAIHGGFVAGKGCDHEGAANPALTIYADDEPVEQCAGVVLIDTIRESLHWLWQEVARRGESLAAGQIILTGSIPRLIPIDEPCVIRVVTRPFGEVVVTVK